MFKKSITAEELNKMPIVRYDGKIVMIEDKEDIPKAMEVIKRCPICGVDTETLPSFKKGLINAVALLQIATDDVVYLIRLNKTGITSDIVDFFEMPDICKVGIAFKEDIQKLNRINTVNPENIIDLNIYCARLGFESIGAKKLAALILGFRISKSQQTSNWEFHTLSESQKIYAATDAWVCREIYLKLNNIDK